MANLFMQDRVVLGELAEWIYFKTGVIITPDESCCVAEEMSGALKASKEKEKALQAKLSQQQELCHKMQEKTHAFLESMSDELDDMKKELLRALTQIGSAEEDAEKLAEECSELKLENKALHLEIENLKGNGRVSCGLHSVSSNMVDAERAVSCPGDHEMRAMEGMTDFYQRGTIHPNVAPQWTGAKANSCGQRNIDTIERRTSLSHSSKSAQASSGCADALQRGCLLRQRD